MREDEKRALREEKKHMLNEMRGLAEVNEKRGAWKPNEAARWTELESKTLEINEQLAEQHERELVEIRKGNGGDQREFPGMGMKFSPPGMERSFAREPLYDAFKGKGFALGETAEVEWAEYRAITWSGSIDNMNQPRRDSVALGYDQRYAYEALPSVGVDSGVTSVSILTQTARTLATPANVIRTIDAVTAKPETTETITVSIVPLKQLATVVSDIPNVFVENENVGSIVQNDLSLALTDALDDLLKTSVAASGFQAPGTDPLLISIRKAMSTVMSSGYQPDTLILRPADAEALDTLRTSGTELFYVFAPGNFAPSSLFGLQRYISKSVAAPIVMDAQAFGKLYSSPVKLSSFEQDAGQTNKTRIRMEVHAQVGVERQAAAVRIAAS
jgi:hypothetical protein